VEENEEQDVGAAEPKAVNAIPYAKEVAVRKECIKNGVEQNTRRKD